MKALLLIALTFGALNFANAEAIKSAKHKVDVARVVALKNLVNKPHIQVNLVVRDLGGGTGMSPTKSLYFNLYAKGEIFSTDASFKIGNIFDFVSARRISGGKYEVTVLDLVEDADGFFSLDNVTYTIDAVDAIVAIKKVSCDSYDCDDSTNFSSTIYKNKK